MSFRRYGDGPRTKFPALARGFLYYKLPALAPPHAGQIRFRITPSSDPASFVDGYDLPHSVNPLPWSILLRRVVHPRYYIALLSQLRHDGLVAEEDVGELICLRPNKPVSDVAHSLYACREPFWLRFGTTTSTFEILTTTEDGLLVVEYVRLDLPQQDAQKCGIKMSGKHCCTNDSMPH